MFENVVSVHKHWRNMKGEKRKDFCSFRGGVLGFCHINWVPSFDNLLSVLKSKTLSKISLSNKPSNFIQFSKHFPLKFFMKTSIQWWNPSNLISISLHCDFIPKNTLAFSWERRNFMWEEKRNVFVQHKRHVEPRQWQSTLKLLLNSCWTKKAVMFV